MIEIKNVFILSQPILKKQVSVSKEERVGETIRKIVLANQYLCNSELIRLDIAKELSERFDCEFIPPRNFMISRS